MSCDSKAECLEQEHICCWPDCQSAQSLGLVEADRMRTALGNITMLRAFQGARRLAKRKRDPNWVFAMEMFGLGSTYAWAMCERMGVGSPPPNPLNPPRRRASGGRRTGLMDSGDFLKNHKAIGFMCLTDFEWEIGEACGGNRVYPSVEDLKASRKCVEGCGIVEVEVSFRRVVQAALRERAVSPSSKTCPLPNPASAFGLRRRR